MKKKTMFILCSRLDYGHQKKWVQPKIFKKWPKIILLLGFSDFWWFQSTSEPQKPPSRPFLIENWSKNTKVMDLCLTLLYSEHRLASLPNPSKVKIHNFGLFWPIFDQKGSRWGFLRLRNRLEPLTIRKSYQKYGKNEKKWYFLTKNRCYKIFTRFRSSLLTLG